MPEKLQVFQVIIGGALPQFSTRHISSCPFWEPGRLSHLCAWIQFPPGIAYSWIILPIQPRGGTNCRLVDVRDLGTFLFLFFLSLASSHFSYCLLLACLRTPRLFLNEIRTPCRVYLQHQCVDILTAKIEIVLLFSRFLKSENQFPSLSLLVCRWNSPKRQLKR